MHRAALIAARPMMFPLRVPSSWPIGLGLAALWAVLLVLLWRFDAVTGVGGAVLAVASFLLVIALRGAWVMAGARARQRGAEAERDGERRIRDAINDSAAAAAALESLPDALLEIDEQQHVVGTNAAARARFGARNGVAIIDVIRDPEILAAIEDALAGRDTVPVPFALPGQVELHYEARIIRPVLARDARPRVLIVFHDVTALRRMDALRVDFVANVSHELRTPLAALLGFVETLQGPARDDAPARARFLEIMRGEAQRMSRLVNDLLSLSRIEAMEHAPPRDRVELGAVIARVADALSLPAREKEMRLVIELAPELPAVTGDGDQLQQLFQNLIDNAIKYGQPKSEIRITARPLGGAKPAQVAIAIADQGDGIARSHLSRLTERFYRVDAGRSRRLGGTGLGLAIVKHIINRHRGTLTIESEVGRGSIFTVHLPAA